MKKLLTIILSATLILSTTACGFNSELEALKKENEKLKAQLESSEKKDTPKPTQNSTPSPTENQSADNNSTYELTAGDYEIPGDIPAGKYDIIAISGDGEFILDGNDNFIDERMSSNAEENSDAIKERKNASLKDGNSITINYNLKVQLVPKISIIQNGDFAYEKNINNHFIFIVVALNNCVFVKSWI